MVGRENTAETEHNEGSKTQAILESFVFVLLVIIPPFLAIIGAIGNVLSYKRMSQKKYLNSTICYYLRCMAIFDSLYIFGRMFLRYGFVVAPSVVASKDVKNPYCLFHSASVYFTKSLSPWILIAMGVDRFIAMNWPLQAAIICTMLRARMCVTVIVIACFVFGGLQFLKTEQEKYQAQLCPHEFGEPMDEVFDTVNGVLFTYLPVSALVFLNIGIVLAVHKSNRESSLSKTKRSSAEKSIALTTVLVVSIFISFNIPRRIDDIFWAQWHGQLTYELIMWQKLTSNIAMVLENANYCLNSYLYVFASARLRKELLEIVTCSVSDRDKRDHFSSKCC